MSSKPIYSLSESIPSGLKEVNSFVGRVARDLETAGLSQSDVFDIKLALEEAVTNAMRHGNMLDHSKRVAVVIEVSARDVSVDVRDEGAGFDPSALPDPTHADNVGKPSGRGVFLMKRLMDKVEYYDGGSGVRMVKSRKGG